ncbi:DL-methionine transporter subunit; membrane component protein of ABC superfamily [[Clostridium] ultunense Esp]|uniref:methionine ABC transporter permease n=1 Tax=Thermicanus aegyptius TaxID=94009 RepID=UPI0002B7025A|nr:methionine ABC transporter permease [Thermicanus aegyptius]CCQ96363.1 DL-methionine transporter subunit; membrane component protein of ABC superfamily [[Clostridium] ultunense Esp]
MSFEHVIANYPAILWATLETLYMVGLSLFFSTLLGIPIGVILIITSPGHLSPNPYLYKMVGTLVNIFRSVPYIVLILWTIPVSRALIGSSFGPNAAILSLIAGSAPFVGRLVESAMREVDRGVIEAAQAMGANRWQIILKVLLPESLPGIISGITVTAVGLVGYSAMAGLVAGGGLGSMAWNLGYNSFQNDTLLVTTVLLILIVQLTQSIGDRLVRAIDKR